MGAGDKDEGMCWSRWVVMGAGLDQVKAVYPPRTSYLAGTFLYRHISSLGRYYHSPI